MDGPFGLSLLSPPVPRPASLAQSPLHWTLVVKLILTVLDDRGDGLEGEVAFRVLHYILQVEILNRKLVVAVLVGTAHRCVVGLAHLGAHGVLLAEIAVDRDDRAVGEVRRVIGLRAVERGIVLMLGAEVRNELLVGIVRQIIHPLLRTRHAEREILLQRKR